MKKRNGFTLIELMIALFIIVSLGAVVMNIFISTLRGARKSEVVSRVRENGNYAITRMSREIQYAEVTSTCDGAESSNLGVINSAGDSVSYSCTGSMPPYNIERQNLTAGTTDELVDATFTTMSEGSCKFTCVEAQSGSNRQVRIEFILEDMSAGNFAENNAKIPFRTTIVLRNSN